MAKKFQRTIEDFVCGHCGAKVRGNGYTNHCPKCLWSRHVDNYPGDRGNPCGGMLRPIGVQFQKGEYHIQHFCEKCGARARCKSTAGDDINALTALSESLAKNLMF